MKNVKRIIMFSSISIIFFCSFMIPRANAQEWTYDGAYTEQIPNYSVFPSEWYIFNQEGMGPPEIKLLIDITKGNITNYMMLGNGTCVYANHWDLNITSGEKILVNPDLLISYWNETVGYETQMFLWVIPVEIDGKVSQAMLSNVSEFLTSEMPYPMENSSIYDDIYSIALWNESYNNIYYHFNWTDDGILTKFETNALGNFSLYSQPAQLAPVFSFTTEHDTLIVDSTDTDLKVAITDADNNNNGTIDTDYLYRIFYGSAWTSWATIPTLIDFDLGSVPAGNYTVILEVKNMYGVTTEQIEIQYSPTEDGDGDGNGEPTEIPGYSLILISIAIFLGISFLIHRNRKKI